MAEPTKICTIIDVPEELREEANQHAVDLNLENIPPLTPDEAPRTLEAALDTKRRWPNSSTVRVCFLDGDSAVHRRIEPIAHEWSQFANIKFEFVNERNADIRIAFDPEGGSWSYLGVDATLPFLAGQATMNYGWLFADTEEEEYRRVVLHEFGHALGLVHEHLQPMAEIPWDESKVIEFYARTNGWDEETTRRNVLTKEFADRFTPFDDQSIMLYPVPAELTVGGFSIPWSNSELSEQDKQFIAEMYPFN